MASVRTRNVALFCTILLTMITLSKIRNDNAKWYLPGETVASYSESGEELIMIQRKGRYYQIHFPDEQQQENRGDLRKGNGISQEVTKAEQKISKQTQVEKPFPGDTLHQDLDIVDKETIKNKLDIISQTLLEVNPPTVEYSKSMMKYNICDVFNNEASLKRPIIKSLWKSSLAQIQYDDVTLVTHFTTRKLPAFSLLAKQWRGPISAALYIHPSERGSFIKMLSTLPNILNRDNIDIHIILKVGIYYPVNSLRRLALEEAPSSHVLVVDVDFIPDQGLYPHLRDQVVGKLKPREVLVIPAFEFLDVPGLEFPGDKSALLDMWDIGLVTSFHSYKSHTAHGATDYKRWVNATTPYKIKKWDDAYEPYILARKSDLPTPRETIVGRFHDKISFLLEVYAMGNEFVVDPSHFLIHMPHLVRFSREYQDCAMIAYNLIKQELREKYPDKDIPKDTPLPKNKS